MRAIDVSEQALFDRDARLLETLLVDHTTGGNIVWATDAYSQTQAAAGFGPKEQIQPAAITGTHAGLIQPRVEKARESRVARTRLRAEVFTPLWLVRQQNDAIDGQCSEPDWKAYVTATRLEVACGEAPYLATRYDVTTGTPVPLEERQGILDRKLRRIGEALAEGHGGTEDEWAAQWLRWARAAVQSVYGFELQGDSLLLARENLLATYDDYREQALGQRAGTDELLDIAHIISWNLWQMDALTGMPPGHVEQELTLFTVEEPQPQPCVVMNWDAGHPEPFAETLA